MLLHLRVERAQLLSVLASGEQAVAGESMRQAVAVAAERHEIWLSATRPLLPETPVGSVVDEQSSSGATDEARGVGHEEPITSLAPPRRSEVVRVAGEPEGGEPQSEPLEPIRPHHLMRSTRQSGQRPPVVARSTIR